MTTLALNAPDYRVKQGADSFETIIGTGIGKGYAIYNKYISKLILGSKVVVLRKDRKRSCAEGILVKLYPTSRYVNGIQRYDVHFKDVTTNVPFVKINFNHYGVAVIGDC